jgi:hypothetical protein
MQISDVETQRHDLTQVEHSRHYFVFSNFSLRTAQSHLLAGPIRRREALDGFLRYLRHNGADSDRVPCFVQVSRNCWDRFLLMVIVVLSGFIDCYALRADCVFRPQSGPDAFGVPQGVRRRL